VNPTDFTYQITAALANLDYGQQPAALYEPIRYIMALGGKRIRPLLTLMGAHLFTDELEPVLRPALATEVFHNFTLLHDDIMDQAPLRRGQSTVHEKWNANVAILSGDVMLVRAYELFLDVEPTLLPTVLRKFSQAAAEVCEGQQWDMNFETDKQVTIEGTIKMGIVVYIVALTAALVVGIRQVKHPENDPRNSKGNRENVDAALHRIKQNSRENDGGHPARRAEAAVFGVVAVAQVGRDIRHDNAPQIQQQEAPNASRRSEYLHEYALNYLAKRVKGQHIKNQVHPVGVQEAGGDKAIPLVAAAHQKRSHNPALPQAGIRPSDQRNAPRQDYEDEYYVQIQH
jgi:hypothetical protein